ncbi:MAG: pyruvoyl-dependent arginine decarboxylase [bacterium]
MEQTARFDGGNHILISNRIPYEFFITQGSGESNIAVHAGSYHLALKDAGIEAYNIICYSSILPGIARQIDKPQGMVHGSVMETIMAVGNFKQGESGAAGIIFGWLYDKQTQEKYGGLVCETSGKTTEKKIEQELNDSLQELYTNGFSEQYDLRDITLISRELTVEKKHGTALVALCFTNYYVPIIDGR